MDAVTLQLAKAFATTKATAAQTAATTAAATDATTKVANEVTRADGKYSTPATVATQIATKADLVSGVIPTSQLPSLALTTAVTVASQAAMLALTTTQVQPGDLAVRTDGAGTFILTATDPTVIGSWTRLNAPTDVVTSVNSQLGAVVLGKTDVGLGNVDNTSDINKPVSTAEATATALAINNQANPILSVTYNGDGTVATTVENGVTTTYVYSNSLVSTVTRAGVTRTYAYDGNSNVISAS